MIGKLTGKLDSVSLNAVVVDVGGVGYEVTVGARTLTSLPLVGEIVSLAIDTHVREDEIRLYGFASEHERAWFRALQSVQGVGAKVALSVLGTLSAADLANAVALQDKAQVSRAPGVGPKVAARIVVELKDKMPIAGAGHQAGRRAQPRGHAARRARRARCGIGADQSRLCPWRGRRSYLRGDRQGGTRGARRGADPAWIEGAGSMSERMLQPARREEDGAETSLRPQTLAEFIGQRQGCANLKVFIEAARARREALDHVLFAGPPGLGKTTLAQIVARELGVNFRATSGPVIAKAGDLAALLTNLEDRDVLFIDEIHRLNPAVEEILYPAMEDYPARSHHRRGAGGALGAHRSCPLHAGGRHHAHGPADHAAAGALRHSHQARILRRR